MFSYDKFTYEVYFYRSGMPASYVVQKGGSCIYAASYYETGLIRMENEGKVHYKVGQGDSAIGIHSFERSSLEFLYEGKHTEYDKSGELIVEKIIHCARHTTVGMLFPSHTTGKIIFVKSGKPYRVNYFN